jgi:hypothetical protein
MDHPMRLRWERRLTFWLNVCGCQTGALLTLSALVWRVSVALHQPLPTWGTMASHLGWVLGAALLGKVGGLAIGRVLLVLDLTRLGRQLATRSALH